MFEHLGPALLLLRKRQDLNQGQIAALANVTRPMLSSYETGKAQPSLEVLARLLKALDATLGDLQHCLQLVAEVTRPNAAKQDLRTHVEAVLKALDISSETEEETQFREAVTGVLRWMVHLRSDLLTTEPNSEEPS